MRPRAAVLLGVFALLLSPGAATQGGSEDDIVAGALAFVAARQGMDGRWGLTAQGYPAEAGAAAGADAKRWPSEARSAFAALTPESAYCDTRPLAERQDCAYKSLLRIVHAAGVSGYDPRDLNGVDGVEQVRAGFVGGQFGQPVYVNDDVWAILALRAAGVPAEDAMVRAAAQNVLDARNRDGGWSHLAIGSASDVDMTGAALAALSAAERPIPEPAQARAFLLDAAAGGGYASRPGGASPSCQSTAWAIHGLHVLGHTDAEGALTYLRSLQRADGGLALTSGSGSSDLFCTVEALVPLARARFPLPAYAAPTLLHPRAHAKEAAALRVDHPFTRLDVEWSDGATGAARTFDHAGVQAFRYHASGPGVSARGAGTLGVLSARPIMGTLPAEVVLHRHAPLVLDLSAGTDPDGRIAGMRIDWGDGNATQGGTLRAEHAYALPGEHVVVARLVDDAGVESHPARVLVRVENRAPLAPALPARIVTDRVEGVALDVPLADPDGDDVALAWRFGDVAGDGPLRFVPTRLGNETLHLTLADAFGGETKASVLVEVVNLPPRLALVLPPTVAEEVELRAQTSDPDGPLPAVAWEVGDARHEGATVRVRLPVGETSVRAVATDAEGARATATATLVRAAEGEPTATRAPEIHAFDARLEVDALVVALAADEGARLMLFWTSDAGDGSLEAPAAEVRVPLAGATWATARVVAERDGLTASRETGLLLAPAPEARAPAPPAPIEAPPSVEIVAQRDEAPITPAPVEEPVGEVVLNQVSLPRRGTPAPALGPILALAIGAALSAAPRRRAR